jgi:putative FmdB family regulatory protein
VPTYQYACTECGGQLEVVQKFSDDPLTVHEACGGKLRKVFSPVGIVFKGSGFYRTDSRGGTSPTAAAATDAGSSSAGPDSKPSSGPDSKPSPSPSDSKSSPAPSASSGADKSSSSSSSGSGGKSAEKVA